MVIGGQQHIVARADKGIRQRVGTVEQGISSVFISIAAEGGLQVRNRVIRIGHIGGDILKNGIEVIDALLYVTGPRIFGVAGEDVRVHQHIPLGCNGGAGRDGKRRFRLLRGGSLLGDAGLRGLAAVLAAPGQQQSQDHNHKHNGQQHQRPEPGAPSSAAADRGIAAVSGGFKFSCHLIDSLLFWEFYNL